MLNRMNKLIGMSIRASDGELGKVKDVYFDDHRWAARYLVVDTGDWLEARKVLISPIAIESVDWDEKTVQVSLTRQRVSASPSVDTDKPVSRQHETDFLGYYGYPNYWGGPFMWGTTSYPYPMSSIPTVPPVHDLAGERPQAPVDPHLRSVQELTGYQLETTDGSMGHVEDFLVDSESWAIRYIIVDTRNWWPGRHVLISPQWITRVDWAERLVTVDVARDTVQSAPEYDPGADYSRTHEASLHRHYQRPGYWQ
jgi:sporulation protein YlmC with PRC-barrel domain